MSDTKIYLELSPELEGALADNGLSIQDILQREAIEVTVTEGVLPLQTEDGARTKDIVTIILASSVAVAAIGFAVSQVLGTVYSRPHKVEYYENVELYNKKGKILTDKKGRPIYKTVKRIELLEPTRQNRKTTFETDFNLTTGMTMKFSSQEGTQEG